MAIRLINVQFTTCRTDVPNHYGIPAIVRYEIAYGDLVDTEKQEVIVHRYGITEAKWIEKFKSGNSDTKVRLTTFQDDETIAWIKRLPEKIRLGREISILTLKKW